MKKAGELDWSELLEKADVKKFFEWTKGPEHREGHVFLRHPAHGSVVMAHDGNGNYRVAHIDGDNVTSHLTDKKHLPKADALRVAQKHMSGLQQKFNRNAPEPPKQEPVKDKPEKPDLKMVQGGKS